MEKPSRKSIRLKNYDYSQNGCYFITICVKNKRKILSKIYVTDSERIGTGLRARPQNSYKINSERVGTGLCARPNIMVKLTPIGIEVEKSIQYINKRYDGRITVDNYCIMPDHLHLLITINNESTAADGHRDPSLRDVIGNFKSYTTKRYWELTKSSTTLWQQRFNDHIIRNDEDYAEKFQYINENSIKYYYKNQNHLYEKAGGQNAHKN